MRRSDRGGGPSLTDLGLCRGLPQSSSFFSTACVQVMIDHSDLEDLFVDESQSSAPTSTRLVSKWGF
jgi:hypothetical protein